MKNFYTLAVKLFLGMGTGVLSLLPVSPLYAAEDSGSEDLKLGAKAYSTGDYSAAERFYRKAVMLLGSPHREEGALQLCRIYLKRGDTAAASSALRTLQKRFPKFDTGVVPGMIMAAEGNTAEAVAEFKRVIALQNKHRSEALYQLGVTCLGAGMFKEAEEAFSGLEKSAVPAEKKRGLCGRIITLIRKKDHKAAEAAIGKSPQDKALRSLELLNIVRSGDFKRFREEWKKESGKHGDPRPEPLLYEISRSGADLAVTNRDIEFAVECLKVSFDFASGDTERRDVMHQLFNLQSRYDHAGAVETIDRYCQAFPEASDKALLQIQGGRLLASSGKYPEAFAMFSRVMKGEENLLDERRSAALDAALAAEKAGMFTEAQNMYQYLISRSTTPGQKQLSEYRMAEFFMRRKDHASAEEYLNKVILQGGRSGEEARVKLLQIQIESEQYSQARQTAQRLLDASDKKHAAYGSFQLARLTRRSGEYASARKLYLDFVKKNPESQYVPAACFAAASLAEQLGDLKNAAEEYLAFAGKYTSDPNAAPALFFALRADCMTGKSDTAEKSLALLQKNHRSSVEYCTARLQLANHYFSIGKSAKALPLLVPEPDTPAELLAASALLHARIVLAAGNRTGALQILYDLLEKYPASSEASEANLLTGNILADLGENKSALEYFHKAEKLQPSGLFGEVVSGRIADCSLDLFSGSDLDRKLLDDALKRYSTLGSGASLPSMRLQSLYKAGKCKDLAGEYDLAMDFFEKTLYYASLLKNSGIAPEPVWCSRAAYAGARSALKKRRHENLVRALQLIRLYEQLSLPATGEDFDSLRKELRNSYNLLKRKGKN